MENLVKNRRESLNLTQDELSKLSNVSQKTISSIENGKILDIESKVMFKIAVALKCDIGDIFFSENVKLTQQSDA